MTAFIPSVRVVPVKGRAAAARGSVSALATNLRTAPGIDVYRVDHPAPAWGELKAALALS